jgi:hypothetical protein
VRGTLRSFQISYLRDDLVPVLFDDDVVFESDPPDVEVLVNLTFKDRKKPSPSPKSTLAADFCRPVLE